MDEKRECCDGCKYEWKDGETLDDVVLRITDICFDCRRFFLEITDEYKNFKDMYTKE